MWSLVRPSPAGAGRDEECRLCCQQHHCNTTRCVSVKPQRHCPRPASRNCGASCIMPLTPACGALLQPHTTTNRGLPLTTEASSAMAGFTHHVWLLRRHSHRCCQWCADLRQAAVHAQQAGSTRGSQVLHTGLVGRGDAEELSSSKLPCVATPEQVIICNAAAAHSHRRCLLLQVRVHPALLVRALLHTTCIKVGCMRGPSVGSWAWQHPPPSCDTILALMCLVVTG